MIYWDLGHRGMILSIKKSILYFNFLFGFLQNLSLGGGGGGGGGAVYEYFNFLWNQVYKWDVFFQ